MSYHGLGASAGFSSGGINVGVNVDTGGSGGGTSPSGCTTTQYGVTGCDECNKTAVAYCCSPYGGPTGKQAADPNTGAFWSDCKSGYRAARKGYGHKVEWFVPNVGMPPPPPPPPAPPASTGLAQYFANVQYQAQLSTWMSKMGKPAPAPAAIKVIGGSGGNRPPASGTPAPSTGKAKAGSVVNTGMGSKPASVPGSAGSSGGGGGASSSSGGTSTGTFKGFSIFGSSGAAKQSSGVKAPSTPVVGQGPIVSTYEVNPDVPPLPAPVTATPMPPDTGWSRERMIVVGVAALAVLGGAYFLSQRSEHVLPRAWVQHRWVRVG